MSNDEKSRDHSDPTWLEPDRIANSLVEEQFVTDRYRNRPEKSMIRMDVTGLLTTVSFQRAKLLALKIHRHLPFRFADPQIREMLQVDWEEYLESMRTRIDFRAWKRSENAVLVFINDECIGNEMDLHDYISQNYVVSLPMKTGYYHDLIGEDFQRFIEKSGRSYVYFTLTVDDRVIGSFLFMLYTDLLPRTCQNFLNLCTGEHSQCKSNVRRCYMNTTVHRVAKNGWIQCGDIACCKGDAALCSDEHLFPDESYCIPHDRRGVLSMANCGRHTNDSQFIVSLKPNPWMDHRYVAFGQLIDGAETLRKIEKFPTYYETPTKPIVISRCGKYSYEEDRCAESSSSLFLKHVDSAEMEGEYEKPWRHVYPGFPGVNPWLDNVVDKLDDRDTISLLMAERYLNGLYCLATDYLPGMDMAGPISKKSSTRKQSLDICSLREFTKSGSFSFDLDSMSDDDKISLICGASREIVACALGTCIDEDSTQRISMDASGTTRWVLEIAREVAVAALAAAKWKRGEAEETEMRYSYRFQSVISTMSVSNTVIYALMRRNFSDEEIMKHVTKKIAEAGIAIVEDVINEAVFHVVQIQGNGGYE